jgi:hypothetical protein
MNNATFSAQKTYIIWLSDHLKSLYEDWIHDKLYAILEADSYKTSDEDDDDDTIEWREYFYNKTDRVCDCNRGALICGRYLNGSITLDTFLAEMIAEDLKEHLFDIPDLPIDLVVKYGLSPENDDDYDDAFTHENIDSTKDNDAATNNDEHATI